MTEQRGWRAGLAVALVLNLTGCASVSVTNYRENRKLAPNQRPTSSITVAPSKTMGGNGKSTLLLNGGHPCAQNVTPTESSVSKTLTDATKAALDRAEIKKKSGGPELVVETRITRAETGSRALRALIGLGAGKTLLETRTLVFNKDASCSNPWLEVWTSGGSNREPGAVFSATPSPLLFFNIMAAAGAAGSLVQGASKGLTQDASRTGKTIGAFVAQKLKDLGHSVKPQSVKYAGHVNVGDTTFQVPFGQRPHAKKTTQYLETK